MPSQVPVRPAQICRSFTIGLGKAFLALGVLAISVDASASDRNKDNRRGACATTYTVVQQDDLGNTEHQGISKAKNRKWADKDLWKRYPDVCYLTPGPAVKAVFLITRNEFGSLTLTVETFATDSKPVVQRTFQQGGDIRPTMYRATLAGHGHHPAKELIEEAVKWIHEGGLDDSF
jgi:hypothetical protein